MKQKSLCCVIALFCFAFRAWQRDVLTTKTKAVILLRGQAAIQFRRRTTVLPILPAICHNLRRNTKPVPRIQRAYRTHSSSTGCSTDKNVQINYTPIDDVNIVVPNGAKSTQKYCDRHCTQRKHISSRQ